MDELDKDVLERAEQWRDLYKKHWSDGTVARARFLEAQDGLIEAIDRRAAARAKQE